MAKAKQIGKTNNILKWVLFALLLMYFITLFFPLLWVLMTSVKSGSEYMYGENFIGFPKEFTLGNFVTAWINGNVDAEIDGITMSVTIPEQFLNSVLYAGGCMLTATFIPCITAYAVARYKYRFGKVVYTIVIVAMILPIVGSLPSEIQMTRALGLYDTFWGLWILKANFLGIYFLVFHAQFKMLPYDYTEAAKIDGASNPRIMFSVILPLAKGTIFTVMLLTFVQFWNDYQIPMMYIPSYPVIAYGMYSFTQKPYSEVPVQVAYMLIVALPIIIVFVAFHKRLMTNLTVGGIKA